jgi:hypothetical protein
MHQTRPSTLTIAPDVASDPGEHATRQPHETERAVMERLQRHSSLRFSTLNVHQYGPDSICLSGLLEFNDGGIDLCDVVRGIHGIKYVTNHVVNIHSNPVPEAGEADECEVWSDFHG